MLKDFFKSNALPIIALICAIHVYTQTPTRPTIISEPTVVTMPGRTLHKSTTLTQQEAMEILKADSVYAVTLWGIMQIESTMRAETLKITKSGRRP